MPGVIGVVELQKRIAFFVRFQRSHDLIILIYEMNTVRLDLFRSDHAGIDKFVLFPVLIFCKRYAFNQQLAGQPAQKAEQADADQKRGTLLFRHKLSFTDASRT
jgi:hypothetical protein